MNHQNFLELNCSGLRYNGGGRGDATLFPRGERTVHKTGLAALANSPSAKGCFFKCLITARSEFPSRTGTGLRVMAQTHDGVLQW
jgi:hypothetical protein